MVGLLLSLSPTLHGGALWFCSLSSLPDHQSVGWLILWTRYGHIYYSEVNWAVVWPAWNLAGSGQVCRRQLEHRGWFNLVSSWPHVHTITRPGQIGAFHLQPTYSIQLGYRSHVMEYELGKIICSVGECSPVPSIVGGKTACRFSTTCNTGFLMSVWNYILLKLAEDCCLKNRMCHGIKDPSFEEITVYLTLRRAHNNHKLRDFMTHEKNLQFLDENSPNL